MILSRRLILKLGVAAAVLSSSTTALLCEGPCRGCGRSFGLPHVYSDRFGAGRYCTGCGRNVRTGRFDFVAANDLGIWERERTREAQWNVAQVLFRGQGHGGGGTSRLSNMRF